MLGKLIRGEFQSREPITFYGRVDDMTAGYTCGTDPAIIELFKDQTDSGNLGIVRDAMLSSKRKQNSVLAAVFFYGQTEKDVWLGEERIFYLGEFANLGFLHMIAGGMAQYYHLQHCESNPGENEGVAKVDHSGSIVRRIVRREVDASGTFEAYNGRVSNRFIDPLKVAQSIDDQVMLNAIGQAWMESEPSLHTPIERAVGAVRYNGSDSHLRAVVELMYNVKIGNFEEAAHLRDQVESERADFQPLQVHT